MSLAWLSPRRNRCFGAFGAGLLALAAAACRSQPATDGAVGSAGPIASVPADRLAPGELPPGKLTLLGLPLPDGMKIEAAFEDVGYARGELAPERVEAFVRQHASVSHLELGDGITVFPRVRLAGAPPDHSYRIEIVKLKRETRLVVRRFVPRPPGPELSEAERWRRAGFNPDGTPLNPHRLE